MNGCGRTRTRTARISLALALALVATLAAVPSGAIDVRDIRAQQVVTVQCHFSHQAPDDPIALPGLPGASHLHDFFGSTLTDALSTYDQLVAGPTSCDRDGDTAAYWMPSVLVDGVPVQPEVATIYYRSFADDPADVVAHPPDFRMIGGDPTATTPQGTKRAAWGCRAEGKKDTWVAEIPDCRGSDTLVFRVDFPECWNGVDLDSPDHRSHVAYQQSGGDCPATHPVSIPELAMTVDYPRLPEEATISMSTGNPFDGHADFWNTWDQTVLEQVVAACLQSSRWCRNSSGPSGGQAPIVEPPFPVRDDGLRCDAPPASGWSAVRQRGAVAQAASLSSDGEVIAYELQRPDRGRGDIVIVDHGVAEVVRAPRNGGRLLNPSLSGDGRWLAIRATGDFAAGDDNALGDIYLHDRTSDEMRLLTVAPDGSAVAGSSFDPDVSADGRFIVFDSTAANLVAGDTNGRSDVFLVDRDTDRNGILDEPGTVVTELVSRATDGGPADRGSWNPAVSDDGRFVTFVSAAGNMSPERWNKKQNVHLRDRALGTSTQLSTSRFPGTAANSASTSPQISGDGSVVVFESSANNMVEADNGMMDVFAWDVAAGVLTKVHHQLRRFPSGRSSAPQVSDDGTLVIFASEENALVPADGNRTQDVFVANLDTRTTTRVSRANNGRELTRPSGFPAISGDGSTVVIETADPALGLRGDQGLAVASGLAC